MLKDVGLDVISVGKIKDIERFDVKWHNLFRDGSYPGESAVPGIFACHGGIWRADGGGYICGDRRYCGGQFQRENAEGKDWRVNS